MAYAAISGRPLARLGAALRRAQRNIFDDHECSDTVTRSTSVAGRQPMSLLRRKRRFLVNLFRNKRRRFDHACTCRRRFHISPYFEIVQNPTIVQGFDYTAFALADKQKPAPGGSRRIRGVSRDDRIAAACS